MADRDDTSDLLPVDDLETIDEPDLQLLDLDCVKANIRNDSRNPFPCVILNTDLEIAWHNEAFQEVFPEHEHSGPTLFSFMSGTPEQIKNDILHALKNPKTGRAWNGRIEVQRKSISTLYANLLIGPVFDYTTPDGTPPIGYRVAVDDVTAEYNNLIRDTFSSLLEASLLKDQDTGKHVARINFYSSELAKALSGNSRYPVVDKEFMNTIGFTAAMHDVGKLGTPDDILNKGGPLEDWEWDVMREHTINGAYILATYPSEMAKQIALFHHEKWNGSGYPYGWNEKLIPLEARIVALADVYDALRMERPYKPAFSHNEALKEMEKGMGEHFDPYLSEVFVKMEGTMNDIYELNKG